jgi:DNA replication licensing factor MCM7
LFFLYTTTAITTMADFTPTGVLPVANIQVS